MQELVYSNSEVINTFKRSQTALKQQSNSSQTAVKQHSNRSQTAVSQFAHLIAVQKFMFK